MIKQRKSDSQVGQFAETAITDAGLTPLSTAARATYFIGSDIGDTRRLFHGLLETIAARPLSKRIGRLGNGSARFQRHTTASSVSTEVSGHMGRVVSTALWSGLIVYGSPMVTSPAVRSLGSGSL